jgi:hypothetical protein
VRYGNAHWDIPPFVRARGDSKIER